MLSLLHRQYPENASVRRANPRAGGAHGRDKRRPSPLEGFHGSREKDHSTELRIISERVVVEGERSRDERRKRKRASERKRESRRRETAVPSSERAETRRGPATGRSASRNCSTESCTVDSGIPLLVVLR
ncbi:hypothetical protein X777_00176 [Ooceraea biroi]|uniref:Uncharacterized protein n=1 Tax=Ooceraea biroi TaxID=2015173 RepID=A0A026VSC5_OOCBI|nr:hypothetical protein X777_00176 [Ooceraea biroi]